MQMSGTSYFNAQSISGPVISYAYVFRATVDPSVTNVFLWTNNLLVKYLPGDTARMMSNGNTLEANCGPLFGMKMN